MNKDELLDEAMKKIIGKDDSTIVDEFNLTGVTLNPCDPGEKIFPTHVANKYQKGENSVLTQR